eukprot:TRINITY_DN5582_c0_g1_i1.p1 TRINITY_DN5582_c0_g1~~TRINITY_DN5582_c0_g1_i1.p1  ORF type:complete len:454 (-),score=124.38 TRINITY_DN5582_c0_g1_i1:198-1505(-)
MNPYNTGNFNHPPDSGSHNSRGAFQRRPYQQRPQNKFHNQNQHHQQQHPQQQVPAFQPPFPAPNSIPFQGPPGSQPPPIPPKSFVQPKHEIDDAFLSTFTRKHANTKDKPKKYLGLTPKSARLKLAEAKQITEKLKSIKEAQQGDVKQEKAVIYDLQKKLDNILALFRDSEAMELLKKKIQKQSKKKRWYKKQRTVKQEQEKTKEKLAVLQSQIVDEWCARVKDENKAHEKAKNLQRESQRLEAQINKRRIYDQHIMVLIQKVETLRMLRRSNLKYKGEVGSVQDGRLHELVKMQLAEQELELRQKQKIHTELEEQLKSTSTTTTTALPHINPEEEVRQYYEKGTKDLDSFLAIRHGWDQFILPPGIPFGQISSKVPPNFPLPPPPSSPLWAQYLVTNNTQNNVQNNTNITTTSTSNNPTNPSNTNGITDNKGAS